MGVGVWRTANARHRSCAWGAEMFDEMVAVTQVLRLVQTPQRVAEYRRLDAEAQALFETLDKLGKRRDVERIAAIISRAEDVADLRARIKSFALRIGVPLRAVK